MAILPICRPIPNKELPTAITRYAALILEIGPFYRQNAPVRDKIGTGYVLEGTVRSAATCQPIPGARIEFWQAGPDGKYSDA